MKLFEMVEWTDGGPLDRGIILGYEKGNSEKELKKRFKINHGFISFREISLEEYNKRKKLAEKNLKMFKF